MMPIMSRKRRLIALQLAIAAAAMVVVAVVFNLGPLAGAERGVLKGFYRFRGSTEPSKRIVIAAIDRASIEALGSWPWPRQLFSNLVSKLRAAGTGTIAIDATFADNLLDNDRRFLAQIGEKNDTVIGYSFYRVRDEIPLSARAWATGENSFDILTTQMLASTGMPSSRLPSMGGIKSIPRGLRLRSGALGFTNLFPAKGRIVYEVPLVVRYRNIILSSFGLAAVGRFDNFTPLLRKDAHGMLSSVTVGKRQIPLQPSGSMILDLTGPAGTYERVSVKDILAGKVSEGVLKDTIVLIGPTFEGPDMLFTTAFGENVPAVELWANAIDNILYGRPLTCVFSSKLVTVGILFILAIMMGLILPTVRILPSLALTAGLAVAIVIDGYLFFSRAGLWFAMATPLAAVVLIFLVVTGYRLATEERMRKRMYARFGTALKDSAIEALVSGKYKLPKRGDKRQLTALTFGIRNFSAVCDELPPEKLIDFIRAYRREVLSYLGSEDAHIRSMGNDLFLAVFGTPIVHSDHARRACRAVLELRRRIAKKRPSWQEKYRMSPFRLAVGIDSGPLVVGEIGSRGRHAYATLGHAVQMSEVFAQLCRTYRTSIIVGAETVQATREWYAYRPLDHIRLRKTKRTLEIFELQGKKGVVTPYIDLYMRAYDAYRLRIYEDTIRFADQLLAKLPHDGPSLLLKARAQRFIKNPPAEEWDGAWIVQ